MTLTKDQLRLLVAYVASWRSVGRTPRKDEIRHVLRHGDPSPQQLVTLGLLHKNGHRPTQEAIELLTDLGVRGISYRKQACTRATRFGELGNRIGEVRSG